MTKLMYENIVTSFFQRLFYFSLCSHYCRKNFCCTRVERLTLIMLTGLLYGFTIFSLNTLKTFDACKTELISSFYLAISTMYGYRYLLQERIEAKLDSKDL